MLHKTRVAIRFRAKKPSLDYPKFCVGAPVVRTVGVRSRDCQIFSDG